MIDNKIDELVELAKIDEPELAIILLAYQGAKLSGNISTLRMAVTKCIKEELIPYINDVKAIRN